MCAFRQCMLNLIKQYECNSCILTNASWKCINSTECHISPTKGHLYWGKKYVCSEVNRQNTRLKSVTASSSVIMLRKPSRHMSSDNTTAAWYDSVGLWDEILCNPFPNLLIVHYLMAVRASMINLANKQLFTFASQCCWISNQFWLCWFIFYNSKRFYNKLIAGFWIMCCFEYDLYG